MAQPFRTRACASDPGSPALVAVPEREWRSCCSLLWLTVVSLHVTATHGAPPQCGEESHADTLGYLHHERVQMVSASDGASCCAHCMDTPWCSSWSFQHLWTPSTPCHLSPYGFEKLQGNSTGSSCGTVRPAAPAPPDPPDPPPAPPVNPRGVFIVDTSPAGRRQVFEGVQVELQSDSIGSYNEGMPKEGTLVSDDDNSTIGAPHDLVPAERERFATEVLRGVRTIRLALGLFLRGMGPQNRSIVGRWPSQMTELKQLQDLSGIEGWAPEYWSPPAGWKSTGSYYSGTLASFDAHFLEQFCRGVSGDVEYLRTNGLNVSWWGLQNEPGQGPNTTSCPPPDLGPRDNSSQTVASHIPTTFGTRSATTANNYARCTYTQCDYYYAFKECAKQIKGLDSRIRIHANSWSGQVGASPVANDPEALALVDAWTWHTVNAPSAHDFGNETRLWNYGKLDFTNEHEYQPGSPFAGTEVGTVAAVNSFLNTLTFKDSPTGCIILHAIKPTTNLESLGYGWTWWRPTGTPAPPELPALQPNHFTWNYWNWNSVAPFVKTVPWNSLRLNVLEDTQRVHQRVVAFETPPAHINRGPLHEATAPGKLILVLTNEAATDFNESFNVIVRTKDEKPRAWRGYSFKGDDAGKYFNISMGAPAPPAASFETTLTPNTVQWWYEQ